MRGSFVIFFDWGLVDFDTLGFNHSSNLQKRQRSNDRLDKAQYSLLEAGEVCRAQGIGFSDDGNQVDPRAQSFHNFNVQRLKGMSCRSDEVEAGMNSEIYLVHPAWLLLLQHI